MKGITTPVRVGRPQPDIAGRGPRRCLRHPRRRQPGHVLCPLRRHVSAGVTSRSATPAKADRRGTGTQADPHRPCHRRCAGLRLRAGLRRGRDAEVLGRALELARGVAAHRPFAVAMTKGASARSRSRASAPSSPDDDAEPYRQGVGLMVLGLELIEHRPGRLRAALRSVSFGGPCKDVPVRSRGAAVPLFGQRSNPVRM